MIANGGEHQAGIGTGGQEENNNQDYRFSENGGTLNIHNGIVTATGGLFGAGIGRGTCAGETDESAKPFNGTITFACNGVIEADGQTWSVVNSKAALVA